MIKKLFGIALLLGCLSVFADTASAQEFVKMSDEQFIELAVDLLRKGVQQEDTTKMLAVFAPEVMVNGERIDKVPDLTGRFQAIFEAASERTISLERPMFSREDNPLNTSNYWDFDIIDLEINIKGDSAFANCELVLWGALGEAGSATGGVRVRERITFVSPPRSGTVEVTEDVGQWSVPPSGSFQSGSRGWVVVGCESLLDFLQHQTRTTNDKHQKLTGEK